MRRLGTAASANSAIFRALKFSTSSTLIDLDVTSLSTDGFSEAGGLAALAGHNQQQTIESTVLGARFSRTFDDNSGTSWTPRLMLGWRNTNGDFQPNLVEDFESTGKAFTVYGTPLAANALVASGGIGFAMGTYLKFDLAYIGQFADRKTDNSVKATLAVSFQ